MDKQVLVSNLVTIAILFLVAVLLSSCTVAVGSRPGTGTVEAYAADMVAAVNGAQSSSRMLVHEGKLRLEARGSRRSSVMIARYDLGWLWVLVPDEARYTEFPLASMGNQFPHFFSPHSTIVRERIGPELVDGRASTKYQVRVSTNDGLSYEGFLWEAGDLPGFPLKWEDRTANVLVLWRNARVQTVPLSLFSVPENFTEICADEKGVIGRANRCRKRHR